MRIRHCIIGVNHSAVCKVVVVLQSAAVLKFQGSKFDYPIRQVFTKQAIVGVFLYRVTI